MTGHVLERTSPKGPGQAFVGRCALCGRTGLPSSAALEQCDNPRALSEDDALLEAVDPAPQT